MPPQCESRGFSGIEDSGHDLLYHVVLW